jgi:catechol 2,3-dioxygenase-like lactoylglutathione lyase family enzyme
MLPAATKMTDLLYVSNPGNGTVTIYNYKNGNDLTLVGTLAGFSQPGGMCTDKSGNVYVTDFATRRIAIYAHGAESPTAVIQQKVGFPYACAVDQTTGDLAVTDEHPNAHYVSHATVDVYAPGQDKGQGQIYGGNYTFDEAYFDAYDAKGNLFVDGTPCQSSYCYYGGGPPTLFELPKGSSTFVELTFNGATLKNPTGLDWVNPTLLLTDSLSKNTPVAYKVFVSGSDATVVATLSYAGTDKAYGVGQRASNIIVPDYQNSTVRIYSLSNGSLISSLTDGLNQPFSAVVSQK